MPTRVPGTQRITCWVNKMNAYIQTKGVKFSENTDGILYFPIWQWHVQCWAWQGLSTCLLISYAHHSLKKYFWLQHVWGCILCAMGNKKLWDSQLSWSIEPKAKNYREFCLLWWLIWPCAHRAYVLVRGNNKRVNVKNGEEITRG